MLLSPDPNPGFLLLLLLLFSLFNVLLQNEVRKHGDKGLDEMDLHQRQKGSIQRQEARDGDLPSLPTEDLSGTHIYEYIINSPEDNGEHVYETVLPQRMTTPPKSRPKPPGDEDHQITNRPIPVRAPPPPPRSRLPSACLPRPPPVPPRPRSSLHTKQLSCALQEPRHKLTRSRTEICTEVSFFLNKDKDMLS